MSDLTPASRSVRARLSRPLLWRSTTVEMRGVFTSEPDLKVSNFTSTPQKKFILPSQGQDHLSPSP